MKKKETNPKDALGIKKAPLSTLPTGPAYEVGLAMLEGARKYGRHNYRAIGVKASVYYDAALRHLCAWWEGENIDSDSGLSHIVKALASLFVLRDSMLMDNWTDDRPPRHPNGLNMVELNKAAKMIIEKYPDCAKPFIETTPGFVDAEELTEELGSLMICNIANTCTRNCYEAEPHPYTNLCDVTCNSGGKCQEVSK